MKILKSMWNTVMPKFLGGELIETVGSVQGEAAMGVTADPQKASGELRVHRVRSSAGVELVTVEVAAHQVSGDSPDLICVRLSPAAALEFAKALQQAADGRE